MKSYIIGFIVLILFLFIIVLAGNGNYNDEINYEDVESLAIIDSPADEVIAEETNPMTEMEEEEDLSIRNDFSSNIIDSSIIEVPEIKNTIPSQILVRKGYITSYNRNTKCPNWVAWHLTREHTDGPFSRKGVPYYDDNGNVIGIGAVTTETCRGPYLYDREAELPSPSIRDYPHNQYGMSHGHMCPAGDNKWSKEAINQSFLMTNMCPQDQSLNQGDWRILEEKCRKWAQKHDDIYIVAGPLYISAESKRTIGDNKVVVPNSFFKVVLCLTGKPKAIGFIYPNNDEHHEMKYYMCTVDEVEARTNMDFFSSLSDDIEDEIEAKCNINEW